ncbi:MAG: M28 family peptidase [Clostridia bacterium]|nr:M28 family peptidase [Clostridia bacterium]
MADLSKIIEKKDEAAKYMEEEITYICKNLPKRDPGSEGEKLSVEHMADILEKDCGCDNVRIESFEEHPRSFFGWIFFTISFVLAGIITFFFVPLLGVILTALGLIIVFITFGLYTKLIDCFFPKKIGHTVLATKKPTGEVKRRILFNGHPDAVWEWRVNYHFGGVAFDCHLCFCILGALYYIILGIICCAKRGVSAGIPDVNDPFIIAAICGLIFVPFEIGLYFMVDYKQVVDGANDNLTGCYMGIALLKMLQDEGITFENTEIGVLNTGSEEAGIRGAWDFSKKHAAEYKDVPTYVYSYDTIHDPKYLMVNYRDLNGMVKTDKDAADLFLNSAKEINVPCLKGWVPPLGGSTDVIGFKRGGMHAAGITGLNHKLEDYYHTRKDSWDNLDLEGLANCFAITAKVLEHYDEGALDEAWKISEEKMNKKK